MTAAELADEITTGYETASETIILGSAVVDSQVFSEARIQIPLAMINRHGLVAGATGTGKTKTLQMISEKLALAGVPVVLADIKGDLSGISKPGTKNKIVESRIVDTNDTAWQPQGFTTQFLSLGDNGIGIPVRASVESFGSVLLSKVLQLNETQEATLGLIFNWAKTQGLELVDLTDLKIVMNYLTSDSGKAELKNIGGVSTATAGVILRSVSNLESKGGNDFFGKPEWEINDLIRVNHEGHGYISLFELADQSQQPAIFSTFLMWLLAKLFQELPEIGDVEKPKLVFVLDEAHLLFNNATKAFKEQVEQTVKLIRSKGVGVFFCSQLPTDIPNAVLSQLGARIQHALRAFTPEDQTALAKTVKTYPKTKAYDLEKALTSLGIGEAIITVLSEKGAPTPVAWTRLQSPRSAMEAIDKLEITKLANNSDIYSKYSIRQSRSATKTKINDRINQSENKSKANKSSSARTVSQTYQSTIIDDFLNNKQARKFFTKVIDRVQESILDKLLGRKGK